MASGASLSAAIGMTGTDERGLGSPIKDSSGSQAASLSRPQTPTSSKRRMGDEASPDPGASPGPKRLAQHQLAPEPPRHQTMTTDDLTHEVHGLFVQKTNDQEYFNQISEAVEDDATRIIALARWCGQLDWTQYSQAASADDRIAQNTATANDNDSQITQDLSLLETQVNANKAATAELRVDVQDVVASIAQQIANVASATSNSASASDTSELQVMRTNIEEFGNRIAHGIEAVRARSNEIVQSAEALAGLLRIEQVHQQLANLDLTIAHTSAALGSRADDSDSRFTELTARVNVSNGPFDAA